MTSQQTLQPTHRIQNNSGGSTGSLFHLDSVKVGTASVVAAVLGIPIFADPLLTKEYVPAATSMSSPTSPEHLPAFKLARYAAHLCVLRDWIISTREIVSNAFSYDSPYAMSWVMSVENASTIEELDEECLYPI